MRRPLLSIVTASMLLAGAGVASAQTQTTTESWSDSQGNTMRQYSTTEKYQSFQDPSMNPEVGIVLPNTVILHPLPETMHVPSSDTYSYGMINDNPVVVNRTTRRVVHTWN